MTTNPIDRIKALPETQPWKAEERLEIERVFNMVEDALRGYRGDYQVQALGSAFRALNSEWKKYRSTFDYKALRALSLQYADVVNGEFRYRETTPSLDSIFSAFFGGFMDSREKR